RQDELAALSQGIDVARYKMIAFVLSALMAGYAGALEAHLFFNVDPSDAQYGVTRAVQILTFAVLGGSGFVLGPIVGALIITLLPYIFGAAGDYINVLAGIFLIVVIVFRPQGIVGRAWLQADELTGLPAYRIAALGIARTFQNIRLFKDLTAVENVLIGMHTRRRDDTLAQLATLPIFRGAQRSRVKDAYALLETVGLPTAVGTRHAATLPYGDQRRLEIARALALKPRLLILDEPAAGMNPSEKQGVRELIERLNADGLTVLLIDHDMRLVMGVCKHI